MINRKVSLLEIAIKHNIDSIIIHEMLFKQERESQKEIGI